MQCSPLRGVWWVRLPSEGFELFSFACFWWEQLAGRSASLRPAVSNVPNLRTAAVSLRMADEASPAAAAVEVFHAFPALTIKKERKCNSTCIVRGIIMILILFLMVRVNAWPLSWWVYHCLSLFRLDV
jgi:hypothetical protein